ncbi:hypothetical protein CBL_10626 [Carabus blaptoides fortunei]
MCVLQSFSCGLKTTYFQFEDTFFQQVEGLPKGSPLFLLIANLFMEKFEEGVLNTSALKPKIEEHSKISFLDILVEKKNLNIATSLYRKPTHAGRYLNFESNHAGSTKIGVAKSLLHRTDTHCSTEEARIKEQNSIKTTLLKMDTKPAQSLE